MLVLLTLFADAVVTAMVLHGVHIKNCLYTVNNKGASGHNPLLWRCYCSGVPCTCAKWLQGMALECSNE